MNRIKPWAKSNFLTDTDGGRTSEDPKATPTKKKNPLN